MSLPSIGLSWSRPRSFQQRRRNEMVDLACPRGFTGPEQTHRELTVSMRGHLLEPNSLTGAAHVLPVAARVPAASAQGDVDDTVGE